MKTSRFFILLLTLSALTFALPSCKKCRNEDPRARIVNNGTDKASVQIKTSEGNTVNINNVDPGAASDYSSYAPGKVTFTITVAGNDYVKEVDMLECYEYDIAIDQNNVVTSTPRDRNE
jgi:hypothetical protein